MADTIEQSLKSITEGLSENFEIVIVDQSNDGSKRLITEFASESDLKFHKVYFDEKLGVARARNIALQKATGDIVITHIDVDDWYCNKYFPAFVELYLVLRGKIGQNFFFSAPNMNISSREYMIEEYTIPAVPIGATGRTYKWMAHNRHDFVGITLDRQISGRIKLSDRKTIPSRIKRTYSRYLGLYRIGYNSRRIVREDIVVTSWSIPSKIFRILILPIVCLHSHFVTDICNVTTDGVLLQELNRKHTYELEEIKEKYDITENLLLDDLTN